MLYNHASFNYNEANVYINKPGIGVSYLLHNAHQYYIATSYTQPLMSIANNSLDIPVLTVE